MTTFGVDLSDYNNGYKDPAVLIANLPGNVGFISHKLGEGTFASLADAAAANGPRTISAALADPRWTAVGAYYVPRTPGNGGAGSVQAQVDLFVSRVADSWWGDPRFGFQIDAERWRYDSVSPATVADFETKLRAKTRGHWIAMYASYGQYNQPVGTSPRWNAAYPIYPGNGHQIAQHYAEVGGDGGAGWRGDTVIWQFTDSCSVGPLGEMDGNAFRGTPAQLQAVLGIKSVDSGADWM